MDNVRAWKAKDGSLHASPEAAAQMDLMHLSVGSGTSETQIDASNAAALVKNRQKVMDVLMAIDVCHDVPAQCPECGHER